MKRSPVTIAVLAFVVAAPAGAPAVLAEEHAASTLLITNVRVWDGIADEATDARNVLIRGPLIEKIAAQRLRPADGATVIDGGGRVLIPGLIDAHTHLAIVLGLPELRNHYDWMYVGAAAGDEARKMLLRGFTTARDIGGPTVGLARAIDEGRIPGPRIYSSGAIISQTSGHADFRNYNDWHPEITGKRHVMDDLGWVHLADGPWEVTRAVRETLRSGATQIKVMAGGGVASSFDPIETVQYTPEEMRAAVVAAENYGTYVAVHAYTVPAIRQALEAGVKCIDHGMLIDEPTMKLLEEKDAFLSPQVYIFSTEPKAAWFTEENRRKMKQVSAGLDNEMKLAKKYGVKIVFGTDVFGRNYADQSKEFELRLRWFTPVEILRQATSTAGELLQLTRWRNPYPAGPLGVIREGAYADVLLVDGNPLEDIGLLGDPEENLRLIVKDGRIYKNTLE